MVSRLGILQNWQTCVKPDTERKGPIKSKTNPWTGKWGSFKILIKKKAGTGDRRFSLVRKVRNHQHYCIGFELGIEPVVENFPRTLNSIFQLAYCCCLWRRWLDCIVASVHQNGITWLFTLSPLLSRVVLQLLLLSMMDRWAASTLLWRRRAGHELVSTHEPSTPSCDVSLEILKYATLCWRFHVLVRHSLSSLLDSSSPPQHHVGAAS